MTEEEIKIPGFAQEDYYLNKKEDEINEKAAMFKLVEKLSEENRKTRLTTIIKEANYEIQRN